MKEDTQETEPVDTVEAEIAALMAEDDNEDAEEVKSEVEETEAEIEEPEAEEAEEITGESEVSEDVEEPEEAETEDEEPEESDDLATSADEEPVLEAPEHWAAADKEIFNNQPADAREWLLDRHKSMEGDYTRKSQEIADTKRQYDAIRDALAPYEQDFARSGLDQAGAVRQLAHWHSALKTGGKAAVTELANMYGIDMTSDPDGDTDPHLLPIQSELAEMKSLLTRQQQEAQQREQQTLLQTIQIFEKATDSDGKLLHPHFESLKDDITTLFQMGKCADLDDAYNKALKMNPSLTPVKPVKEVKIETVDKKEQVRKAKKAATGVKSSGAVGKKSTENLSLEQEIASLVG